jgi:Mn2+/Fe2+ NRAMP family transporter
MPAHDPYVRTEEQVKDPPATFGARLRHLGPGLVLTASIVGSGELIATTALGAKAGFVTLWVILVSCMCKVVLQLEFGKHVVHTGESTMAAFNRLPGPRLLGANWTIWAWLVIMASKFVQLAGILGGVALVLQIVFPRAPLEAWTVLAAVAVALLVFRGYYRLIERAAVVMICLFALVTIACVVMMQWTQYATSWRQLGSGLTFQLPAAAVAYALAAFGITGVGGDEVMQYGYWCLEKGYGAYTGPRREHPEWLARARGWIKVMYLDALVSMLVYTVITAAFYVLGAAVLHGQGEVPEGFAMVKTLSTMYTETLGPWASELFLFGAFVVLFSTLFAALAGWTRTFADAFGQIGLINFHDQAARWRTIGILAWVIPVLWTALFLWIKAPVFMVILGGIGTSVMLLLVVFAALHFRYRRLIPELKPSALYDAAFWLSAAAIGFVGVYGLYTLFAEHFGKG